VNPDPVASLHEAIRDLEKSRRRAIDELAAAREALNDAPGGKSAAATKTTKEAAKRTADAADRVGSLQFNGSYKGTNASFLPSGDRRMLAGIALAAAVLFGGWVFLIATLAAAQLEPGQRLALGGTWILIGLVAGFLVVAVLIAYGFRTVHIALRSVDGETAEVERSAEVRARKRLERQLAQASRDAERAQKRAEKIEADLDAARARADAAEAKAATAAEERDELAARAEGNGAVDKETAVKTASS